jgi:hypothetical protein
MKYYTKLKVWKASNFSYDPHREIAISYNWWHFVNRINGLLVFNNYAYSTTTRMHQHKMRRLLAQLGSTIDLEIECPSGLQDTGWIESTTQHYNSKIMSIYAAIEKPKSNKLKNEKRYAEIAALRHKLAELDRLMPPIGLVA